MGKVFIAVIVTIIMGWIGSAVGLELLGGFSEFGSIIAIAIMGGFIIFFNNNKK